MDFTTIGYAVQYLLLLHHWASFYKTQSVWNCNYWRRFYPKQITLCLVQQLQVKSLAQGPNCDCSLAKNCSNLHRRSLAAFFSLLNVFFRQGDHLTGQLNPLRSAQDHPTPTQKNSFWSRRSSIEKWKIPTLFMIYNVEEEQEDNEKNCAMSAVDRHIMIPFSQTSNIFIVLLYPSD